METLSFYDVENATTTTALDLGSVAPSSSDDTMIRVVNNSDFYQAEDITVTVDGPDAVQLWLSVDGDIFTDSITIGDVPPGGTSASFYLRRVTPADVTATRNAVLSAVPASWSNPIDTSSSVNVPLVTED